MDATARAELNDVISKLRAIINELDDVSKGVRKDFVGIGNAQVANCIDSVANQYRVVLKKLNNLDTTAVVEGFANA